MIGNYLVKRAFTIFCSCHFVFSISECSNQSVITLMQYRTGGPIFAGPCMSHVLPSQVPLTPEYICSISFLCRDISLRLTTRLYFCRCLCAVEMEVFIHQNRYFLLVQFIYCCLLLFILCERLLFFKHLNLMCDRLNSKQTYFQASTTLSCLCIF